MSIKNLMATAGAAMAEQRVSYNWINAVCSIICPACGVNVIVDSENGETKCPNDRCSLRFKLNANLTVIRPEIVAQTEISQTGAAGDQPTVN